MIDKSEIFYDKSKAMSYNAMINFIMGGRGVGKTFAYKLWACTKRWETVWVRRRVEDIQELAKGDRFYADLVGEGVVSPDTDFYVDTSGVWIDGEKKIHFVPLSVATRRKSISFHNTDTMIFDEVFEEKDPKNPNKGRYLPDEVTDFLGLFETVNRMRLPDSGRPELRAFLLGNKTTFDNPYFSYWGIYPFSDRFRTYKNGLILVENYRNEAFIELKKQTRFGQLIDGTDYGNYAIENIAWYDDNAFIEKRKPTAKYVCSIRLDDAKIGLWLDENLLFCSQKFNPSGKTFAKQYDCIDDEIPLKRKEAPLTWIENYYYVGKLRFEDNICKNRVFRLMQGEYK